jgi:hypothetical protein
MITTVKWNFQKFSSVLFESYNQSKGVIIFSQEISQRTQQILYG